MVVDGFVLSVPALWSVEIPIEQRNLADDTEHVPSHQRLAGARHLLLRSRAVTALGVEFGDVVGRAIVPDLRLLVPDDGGPRHPERPVMAVPAASLLPDLRGSGVERTAALLFMAQYSYPDRIFGIADFGDLAFAEVLA